MTKHKRSILLQSMSIVQRLMQADGEIISGELSASFLTSTHPSSQISHFLLLNLKKGPSGKYMIMAQKSCYVYEGSMVQSSSFLPLANFTFSPFESQTNLNFTRWAPLPFWGGKQCARHYYPQGDVMRRGVACACTSASVSASACASVRRLCWWNEGKAGALPYYERITDLLPLFKVAQCRHNNLYSR